MEEKKEQAQGKPWVKVGTYSTYEEAKDKVLHMSATQPTYNFKIKRSGDGGSLFTVKKRIDPKMAAIEKKMDENLSNIRAKNNSKKKSKTT